ncbi:MAG: ATP-grasp domain-containing protein [Spirochaetes bacterium]|nr:MAG: ATP-grasp domain-containing protein [Spirochaetota bacterium]
MSLFKLPRILKRTRRAPARLFISIGMGENQLPLIREARALGFRVIGVDRDTRAFAATHCDLKIQESIENFAEIFTHLEDISVYGDIRGVLSKSYGPAVRTASYIANMLGFPMFPSRRMDDFIVKKRMKEVFQAGGIPSPEYLVVETSARGAAGAARLGFPLVVKPVTGHAKTGVRMVTSRRELQRFAGSIRGKGAGFIAERFVEGDEIIALGIIHGRTFHLASLSDKETTPAPYFVDLLHVTPSRHHALWTEVTAIGQRIAEAFEIEFSPLVIEMRVDSRQGIQVIEAVPEFGGECLPDHLVPLATGYNFLEQAVRAATGMTFTPPPARAPRLAVAVKYLTADKGRLLSLDTRAPRGVPGIVYSRFFKALGAEVGPPADNHDRIGVIVAKGRTREAALDAAALAARACAVTVGRGGSEK